MWLAVILHCITLEADTCDIMVRTGGLFQDKPACSDSVTKMGKALSKISERGRIKILMPSGNAYGTTGNTTLPEIPGDVILIFDIHLIKIRK